jgi:hypothetical protein
MWETRLSTCAFYPPACVAHLIAGQLPNNDHGVMVAVMTPMVMTIRLRVSRDRKEGDERE